VELYRNCEIMGLAAVYFTSEPAMTRPTKLLTSCARNDAAVGRFWGFLSSLFLFGAASSLVLGAFQSSHVAFDFLTLLSALPVGLVVGLAFYWLRPRFPDFARGYRSGSLIVAIFFCVLSLWWDIQLLTAIREGKDWAQRHQAQSHSDPIGALGPN
jgi:hypothetical protein